MNALAPDSLLAWLARRLPRGLESQLLLLTSLCLSGAILGYSALSARQQVASARQTVTAQLQALAQNLATVNAHFISTGEAAEIERLVLQTATVDGIYSVLALDADDTPITEVVNRNGRWSPRFSRQRVATPARSGPDAVLQTQAPDGRQADFLAGSGGTLSAWRRISAPQHLGWVRVNYRLDTFEQIARDIRLRALKFTALALALTLTLLWLLLRPATRALREATAFAGGLDSHMGARLKVSRLNAELQSLGEALNVVSQRLQVQNLDLANQKFALDEHAIVSITDLQGNIVYANQRFCDISGYTREEFLGQNHRIVKSGEHPPAFYSQMWETLLAGRVWHGELKNRKKDGGFYWVNATIVPLTGVDGLPHHFIGIRTDITASKNLERSLQSAKETAEGAAAAKSQFVANMSHEIRTPMNAILGMLRLLQNTGLDKRQLDYVAKADGAAHSLLNLINDILDFSKIDAGKMTLEARPFRLDKLLRELGVIVSANVGAKPVEVLFDMDKRIPRLLIGDALRLQQVLINLCSNAIKFTPRGNVVFKIRQLEHDAGQVTLRFAVRDEGIGIAPENQERIFEGFSQAEASTTRRFGGTGLGLSISRRLVRLMGGELNLQSELGAGSTFSFEISLPVGAPPAEAPPLDPALTADLRVLVVDDNPLARDILQAMVQSLGWQAELAQDGAQALARLAASATPDEPAYQVVLMDWQMSGMDGWETLRHIGDIALPAPRPLLIMVSANGRDQLSQRTPQEQALLNGFLVKPLTASMLFDAVCDALASRNPAQGEPAPVSRRALPLQGLRLLVVEDNIVNQQVAQEMLSNEGAEVCLADNGQQGVQAVLQAQASGQPFDVVLMDLQMPVMDGYAATQELRRQPGLARLPIIAMTANAMASDRDACLAAGMNDHVGKPFNLTQLIHLIQHPTPLAEAAASASDGAAPPPPPAELPAPIPTSASPALPPVNAVDSSAALDRLGGNQQLYGRILAAYLQDIQCLPEQFDACLTSANLTSAERLLHTLKGLSATVGASYMAAVARRAELRIQQARTQSRSLDALALAAELRTALHNTQTVMQRVAESCQQPPADPRPSDPANAAPSAGASASAPPALADADAPLARWRLLRDLLRSANMQAVDVYEQLRQDPAQQHRREWTALIPAMNELDFERAARLCQALLEAEHAEV